MSLQSSKRIIIFDLIVFHVGIICIALTLSADYIGLSLTGGTHGFGGLQFFCIIVGVGILILSYIILLLNNKILRSSEKLFAFNNKKKNNEVLLDQEAVASDEDNTFVEPISETEDYVKPKEVTEDLNACELCKNELYFEDDSDSTTICQSCKQVYFESNKNKLELEKIKKKNSFLSNKIKNLYALKDDSIDEKRKGTEPHYNEVINSTEISLKEAIERLKMKLKMYKSNVSNEKQKIIIDSEVREKLFSYIADFPHTEQGGLLISWVHSNEIHIFGAIIPPQSQNNSIYCEFDQSHTVHLRTSLINIFDQKYFLKFNDEDPIQIDWVHTHPNLTIFLSSTDRNTFSSWSKFKKEPIAVVIDPFSNKKIGVFNKSIKEIDYDINDEEYTEIEINALKDLALDIQEEYEKSGKKPPKIFLPIN